MTDEKNRPDNLDNLINLALESYTPREPQPGLEQRILASVAAGVSPRSHLWNWKPVWALAAAAAALLVVVTIPVWHKAIQLSPMRQKIAVVHHPPVAVVEHSSAAAPAPVSYTQRTHASSYTLPVATGPVALETVTKSSPGLIAPLTIAPIRNQPLTDEAIAMKPITIDPIQISALN